jgi:hypothetical protein
MKKFFMLIASAMLLSSAAAFAADAPAASQGAESKQIVPVKDLQGLPEKDLTALFGAFTPEQMCDVIAVALSEGDEALTAKVLACAEAAINAKPVDQRVAFVDAINNAGAAEASEDEENAQRVSIVPVKKTTAEDKDRDGIGAAGQGGDSVAETAAAAGILVDISALSGDGLASDGFFSASSASGISGTKAHIGNSSAPARRK